MNVFVPYEVHGHRRRNCELPLLLARLFRVVDHRHAVANPEDSCVVSERYHTTWRSARFLVNERLGRTFCVRPVVVLDSLLGDVGNCAEISEEAEPVLIILQPSYIIVAVVLDAGAHQHRSGAVAHHNYLAAQNRSLEQEELPRVWIVS